MGEKFLVVPTGLFSKLNCTFGQDSLDRHLTNEKMKLKTRWTGTHSTETLPVHFCPFLSFFFYSFRRLLRFGFLRFSFFSLFFFIELKFPTKVFTVVRKRMKGGGGLKGNFFELWRFALMKRYFIVLVLLSCLFSHH